MEKKQIMEDAVPELTEHALQKRRKWAGENGDTLTDEVRELSIKVKAPEKIQDGSSFQTLSTGEEGMLICGSSNEE